METFERTFLFLVFCVCRGGGGRGWGGVGGGGWWGLAVLVCRFRTQALNAGCRGEFRSRGLDLDGHANVGLTLV